MFVSRSIQTNHADLIHDVAYDFYGRRMATCSSDQTIKIWDLKEDGEWVCTASWSCHLGSAWRVSWAHPEFGQVIATCSFDRTIAIWEEITGDQTSGATGNIDIVAPISTPHSNIAPSNTSWIRRAYLVDSRTSVTGLQFAPRHLGLQLAALSTDGMLRIYEALDVMNLSQWRLQFDFGTKMAGSCLAWSQSRFDPPLIAVGSSSAAGSAFGDNLDSNSTPMNQTGSAAVSGFTSHPIQTNASTTTLGTNTSTSLVTGKLILYEYSDVGRHWDLVEDVHELDDSIYDLEFAPHMGQSYHTLAVGSKAVYILRIRSANHLGTTSVKNDTATSNLISSRNPQSSYEIRLMAHFDHHKGRVWRVSWNVTGSLLASSGDDGCVRLWQSNYLGVWLPISVISPDGSHCSLLTTDSQSDTRESSPVTKSNLNSMVPLMNSNVTGSNTQPKGSHPDGDQSVGFNAAKGVMERPNMIPFSKIGSLSNGNHPVVWH